jgi:hypothetical protein
MEQIAMGVPNIQQQLYLKKALNENMDGMFDHPEVQPEETITEGLMGKIKSIVRKVKQRGILATTLKPYAHDLVRDKANRVGNADPRGRTARSGDKKKGFFDTEQARGAGKTAAKRFHRIANPNYGKHPWEIKKNISEGSIGSGKIFSGKKGNKFHPEKDRKYHTKTAVRQLIKRGKDPNLIKISSTQGLENYGFHVNADDKRKAALTAKRLANFGFGVNAIIKRKAALRAKGKYT